MISAVVIGTNLLEKCHEKWSSVTFKVLKEWLYDYMTIYEMTWNYHEMVVIIWFKGNDQNTVMFSIVMIIWFKGNDQQIPNINRNKVSSTVNQGYTNQQESTISNLSFGSQPKTIQWSTGQIKTSTHCHFKDKSYWFLETWWTQKSLKPGWWLAMGNIVYRDT